MGNVLKLVHLVKYLNNLYITFFYKCTTVSSAFVLNYKHFIRDIKYVRYEFPTHLCFRTGCLRVNVCTNILNSIQIPK